MNIETIKAKFAESEKSVKALSAELEELKDFVENAAVPLHWVNGSGIIIWANQAELDSLGYQKDEYVGKHISTFHADKKAIEDILTRLINKETLRNYPARLQCKNGDIKSVLINSNVLWKDDKFIHTRCFTRDISELKEAETKKLDTIMDLQRLNKELKVENEKLRNKMQFI